MTEGIIAAIAAAGGGILLKLIEWLLRRGSQQDDLAKDLRDELRADAISLRELVLRLRKDLEAWKARYYDLLEELQALKIELLEEQLYDKARRLEDKVGDDTITSELQRMQDESYQE